MHVLQLDALAETLQSTPEKVQTQEGQLIPTKVYEAVVTIEEEGHNGLREENQLDCQKPKGVGNQLCRVSASHPGKYEGP